MVDPFCKKRTIEFKLKLTGKKVKTRDKRSINSFKRSYECFTTFMQIFNNGQHFEQKITYSGERVKSITG